MIVGFVLLRNLELFLEILLVLLVVGLGGGSFFFFVYDYFLKFCIDVVEIDFFMLEVVI